MEATVRVLRTMALAETIGGACNSIEERTVKTASKTPAVRVMFVSPTEHVNGDAAEGRVPCNPCRDRGLDVELPVALGRGGCRIRVETVSAM